MAEVARATYSVELFRDEIETLPEDPTYFTVRIEPPITPGQISEEFIERILPDATFKHYLSTQTASTWDLTVNSPHPSLGENKKERNLAIAREFAQELLNGLNDNESSEHVPGVRIDF